MMCPVWLFVVVMVGVARGAVNHCWAHPSCQELNSDGSMMECIRLCHSHLPAVVPGDVHLQASPPSDLSSLLLPSSSFPQAKHSYSMEHFRWGKPVVQKRRPVKVFTSDGVEEESAKAFPGDMRRPLGSSQDMMSCSHCGGPSADKRYGGFMKSWDERSQRPLLTLFKNVIHKNSPQND